NPTSFRFLAMCSTMSSAARGSLKNGLRRATAVVTKYGTFSTSGWNLVLISAVIRKLAVPTGSKPGLLTELDPPPPRLSLHLRQDLLRKDLRRRHTVAVGARYHG